MKTFTILLTTAVLAIPGLAAFPQIKLEVVCEHQIDSPVAMVSAGDGSGRMFVCDQRGKIRIFRNGMLEPGVFLNVGPKLVNERAGFDERGLLGMAFHPGYTNAASPGFRKFYLFYIAPSPNAPGIPSNPVDSREVIAEYQVSAGNPDVADIASERILLSFDKPQFNHNGGGIEFGPDGMLYFSVGDGGSSNDNNAGHTGGSNVNPRPTNALGNAQDLTRWLGKIHRIDPFGNNGPGGQYGIPVDNPFVGAGGGVREEIYAYGLRNPWRFCFDDRPGGTGRMYCADVGQGQVEEIDLIISGFNYGWRNKEGSFFPSFSAGAPPLTGTVLDPIAQYAHPGITIGTPPLPQYGISVTGGYVYRGSAIPGLVGKYVFADFSMSFSIPLGRMLGMEETAPEVFALANLDVLGVNPVPYFIQGFGQDDAGELYVLARKTLPVSAPNPATGLPSGSILKIVPVPAPTLLNINASKDNTIYQEVENSNGAGSYIFSGATQTANNGALRRALLGFGLTGIPAGATVASASLRLQMDRTVASAYDFSLHRMTADWGEGTANADVQEGTGAPASATDATWQKPFFGQPALWVNEGGDFSQSPSATLAVAAEGTYTWSAPQLAYDINAWLATPATNFGWLLKADLESSVKAATGAGGAFVINVADTDGLIPGMTVTGTNIGPGALIAPAGINVGTNDITLTVSNVSAVAENVYFATPSAKRFHSRTAPVSANRPRLTVNYVPAPVLSRRRAWELANFFIGEFISDSGDTDKDGIVDGIEYAWGFPAKTPNLLSDGLTVDPASLAGGGALKITFRRDALATDVTYQLQLSGDLVNWTTIATSVGGAVPTGIGYVSESVISGSFRAVLCTDSLPVATQRYARLKITRL
jgi:glucose/arabinose dehydrogenase